MPATYPKSLPLGLTAEMHDALSAAAAKMNSTLSDYTREALTSRLVRDGFAAPALGRTVEQREREALILGLPEAKGRRELATHLALHTAMSGDQARQVLLKSAADEAEIASEAVVENYRAMR